MKLPIANDDELRDRGIIQQWCEQHSEELPAIVRRCSLRCDRIQIGQSSLFNLVASC